MDTIAELGGGITQELFEAKRREIALRLLEKTDQLLGWDLDFNKHISSLAEVLVGELKRNPKLLESNGGIRDIIRDLNAKAGQGAGVSGGDIVGGDFGDKVWDVIETLLLGEKKLIESIIEKIFDL